MAPQQSRGGTFEVGQVAAGNESFTLNGSPRWEQEEQDTPAHPQATRRRGVGAEETSMKDGAVLAWIRRANGVFFPCVCMLPCEIRLHRALKLKCSAHAYAPTFCALSHSNAKEQQRYIHMAGAIYASSSSFSRPGVSQTMTGTTASISINHTSLSKPDYSDLVPAQEMQVNKYINK